MFGDYPNRVSGGTVNDPANRTSHEVDVAVYGLDDDNRQPLLAIGEAKWGDVMGMGHLDRLRRVRSLLTAQGRPGAGTARLACFSGAGFTDELRAAASADTGIVLIDLATLYRVG
ncbi:hypothetical protein [Actinoplanes flavus]|uniref:hypothetical protein n=1 Tax=Actinoplanes flavus TaxID=2820290 RepID=UPI001EE6309D|nr:hypothetical protein [Actinoplanes flavus]